MAIFEIDFRPAALVKNTKVLVFYPDGMPKAECPVLYLLHGFTDDYSNWLRWSSIERYAALNGLAVVMPDGGTSWYCNEVGPLHYYDYISKDLPQFIQNTFDIGKDPKKCFIGGLSMGGYGAAKIGLRNPENYAGIVAFSGAYDPMWVYTQHRPVYDADFQIYPWKPEDDPYQVLENFPAEAPKLPLYLACGTQDPLYPQSTRFRDLAIQKGFQVQWDELPFNHEWAFWDVEIEKAIHWMLKK